MAAKKKSVKKTSKKSTIIKKTGTKNSLVSNINARKKKGNARSKKDSTIDKEQYKAMKNNWKEKSKK